MAENLVQKMITVYNYIFDKQNINVGEEQLTNIDLKIIHGEMVKEYSVHILNEKYRLEYESIPEIPQSNLEQNKVLIISPTPDSHSKLVKNPNEKLTNSITKNAMKIYQKSKNKLKEAFFKDNEVAFPSKNEYYGYLIYRTLYEKELQDNGLLQIQYVLNTLKEEYNWAIVFRHNNRGFSFNSLNEVCIFEFDAEDRFYVVHKTLSDPRLTSSSLGKLWDDKLNLIKPDELQNPVLGGSKKKKSAKKFEFF